MLWRYTTGRKGFNRVTVYERESGGPLQVEFWTVGPERRRVQRSLRYVNRAPVYDKELAMQIADAMSLAQAKHQGARTAHALLGRPEPRTLGELLKEYHAAKEARWSYHHDRTQRKIRDYWLDALGRDARIDEVTERIAERLIHAEAARSKWKPRTIGKHLKYLQAAFNFAVKKLKWLPPEKALTALEIPAPRGESRAYTRAEARKLLPKAVKRDLRCGAAAWIAYDTGRRINAIRTLTVDAFSKVDAQHGVIAFPGATDKARMAGVAVLSPEATRVVERLMQTPAVKASGKLFPSGDLNDPAAKRFTVSDGQLTDWLHEAEEAAGVPTIHRRAYHGLKRRYATDSKFDRETAGKQSGTDPQTLSRVYLQDELDDKIAFVKALAEKRRHS